jgi:hypothetical protein
LPLPVLLSVALLSAAPDAPVQTLRDVTITAMSDRPMAGSGVIAFFVTIEGRMPAGDPVTLYMVYGGAPQPLPAISSLCAFEVQSRNVYRRSGIPGLVIGKFACSLTSDSPMMPDPPKKLQSLPSAE